MRMMVIRGRCSKLALLVILGLPGCGEEAPAAPPEVAPEFDDPFADEVTPAAPPAPPTTATPAPPAEPAPPSPPNSAPEATPERAPVAAPGALAVVARRKPTRGSAPVPQDMPSPPAPEPPIPADIPAAPEPAPPPAPVAVKPVMPDHERFTGSYTYAGGQAQRDQVAAAIEATVMALNVLFRPIARKRITEGNPLREQVGLAVAGKSVTVSFGADRKVSGQLDGPAIPWTSDTGSPLTVTFSLVKGRIVMNCVAKDGARRNVFTLDESGDRLTMSVTMSSERLPVPVKYALSYRRK